MFRLLSAIAVAYIAGADNEFFEFNAGTAMPGIRSSLSNRFKTSYEKTFNAFTYDESRDIFAIISANTLSSDFQSLLFNRTASNSESWDKRMDDVGFSSPARTRAFYRSMLNYDYLNIFEPIQDFLSLGWESIYRASHHQLAPNNSLTLFEPLNEFIFMNSSESFPDADSYTLQTYWERFSEKKHIYDPDESPDYQYMLFSGDVIGNFSGMIDVREKLLQTRQGCYVPDIDPTDCIDYAEKAAIVSNNTSKEYYRLYNANVTIPDILKEPLQNQKIISGAVVGALQKYNDFFIDFVDSLAYSLNLTGEQKDTKLWKELKKAYKLAQEVADCSVSDVAAFDKMRTAFPRMFSVHQPAAIRLSTSMESVKSAWKLYTSANDTMTSVVAEWSNKKFPPVETGLLTEEGRAFFREMREEYVPAVLEQLYRGLDFIETFIQVNGGLWKIMSQTADTELLSAWVDNMPESVETPSPPSAEPWNVAMVSATTLSVVAALAAAYVFLV